MFHKKLGEILYLLTFFAFSKTFVAGNIKYKYYEDIKSLKNTEYFFAQMFEEGVWDTEESGFGLIKTNENGLDYKDLIFHIAEILGRPICFAISYGKKKYDLIGNTMTNSSQMKVYKN